MQNDGNLVIYNNALARNDYEGGSVIWNTGTHRAATASGVSFYQVNSANQFVPANVYGGRAGALGYELVGSQPSSGQVGNTTTAQETFSHTDPELGARTITVTFTLRANNLPDTHYTGEARAWNGTPQFLSTQSLFRGEIFEAIFFSSGNPFRTTTL